MSIRPERLEVKAPCQMVSGVVADASGRADGDFHINLVLDQEYRALLNKKNLKKQKGALVVEIVCESSFSFMRERACENCPHAFPKPKKGDRIRVWGSYVLDRGHGWMEIHPVMKIEIMSRAPRNTK